MDAQLVSLLTQLNRVVRFFSPMFVVFIVVIVVFIVVIVVVTATTTVASLSLSLQSIVIVIRYSFDVVFLVDEFHQPGTLQTGAAQMGLTIDHNQHHPHASHNHNLHHHRNDSIRSSTIRFDGPMRASSSRSTGGGAPEVISNIMI
jgi:hypothetical protein